MSKTQGKAVAPMASCITTGSVPAAGNRRKVASGPKVQLPVKPTEGSGVARAASRSAVPATGSKCVSAAASSTRPPWNSSVRIPSGTERPSIIAPTPRVSLKPRLPAASKIPERTSAGGQTRIRHSLLLKVSGNMPNGSSKIPTVGKKISSVNAPQRPPIAPKKAEKKVEIITLDSEEDSIICLGSFDVEDVRKAEVSEVVQGLLDLVSIDHQAIGDKSNNLACGNFYKPNDVSDELRPSDEPEEDFRSIVEEVLEYIISSLCDQASI